MNKKLIGFIFGLIIIISSALFFSSLKHDSKDVSYGEDQDFTNDDILDEINESLSEEDDEIEIGEMA